MSTTKIKWTSERDYELLSSLKGHRPIGIDKHFHMMFILEKFRSKNGLNVSGEALWDRLEELYNLKELNEREVEMFTKKTTEFALPADFKSISRSQNCPRS